MFRSPEKNHQLSTEKEQKRFWKRLSIFLAVVLLFVATVDDIRLLDKNIYPTNQTELEIRIPPETDRESQSLIIAQNLVANMEISEDDLQPPGGYGVMGQVIYGVTEEEVERRYRTELDLNDVPHHLAVISYFMLEDQGVQTADIILGDWLAIRLTDRVFDAVNFLTPTINATNSHRYDIETTSFILDEAVPGIITISKILIRHHGILTVYEPEVLRISGNPPRIQLAMSRGKHAIYPSQAACQNGRFNLLGLITFSADVCDPDLVIHYQIESDDMVGEPGSSRNPMADNSDYSLFPEGSDARDNFGRAYTPFIR